MQTALGAQEAVSEDTLKKVVILSTEAEIQETSELLKVLEAHLADLGAVIEVVVAEQSPHDIFSQVSSVRTLAVDHGAFSVIWVKRANDQLFLFISDKRTENVFIKTLESSEESWTVECDLIAAMVRSALISWLEIIPPEKAAEEIPKTTATDEKVPEDSPPKTPIQSEQKGEARVPHFFTAAAYEIWTPHFEEKFMHGARVTLGLLARDKVQIDLSSGFSAPARLSISEADVYFGRVPISLGIGRFWSPGSFRLGIRGAICLDITYLVGSVTADSVDKTSHLHPGISASLFGRYHLHRHFFFFGEFGASGFIKPYSYVWKDNVVFRYARIQPWLLLGLGLQL